MRSRAAILLAAWFLGLWLPLFHVEESLDPAEHGATHAAAANQANQANQANHVCSAVPRHVESGPAVRAACPGDDRCHDPYHHHHPISHHDATQCPVCSSLLERLAETPVLFDAAPTRVELVAVAIVRVPPLAQRLVVALARGPPSPPFAVADGAHVA